MHQADGPAADAFATCGGHIPFQAVTAIQYPGLGYYATGGGAVSVPQRRTDSPGRDHDACLSSATCTFAEIARTMSPESRLASPMHYSVISILARIHWSGYPTKKGHRLHPVRAVFLPPAMDLLREPGQIILRDGTTAEIRVSLPSDGEAMRLFIDRLSAESKRHRFFF